MESIDKRDVIGRPYGTGRRELSKVNHSIGKRVRCAAGTRMDCKFSALYKTRVGNAGRTGVSYRNRIEYNTLLN